MLNRVFNLRPTRSSAEAKGVEVVADLDALVSKSIGFQFQGRMFVIKPMTTGETLEAYATFAKIDELAKQFHIASEDIVAAYAQIFGKVCPQFTRKHVEELTPPQLSALFHLVLETVTGRVHTRPDIQKKTVSPPNAEQQS